MTRPLVVATALAAVLSAGVGSVVLVRGTDPPVRQVAAPVAAVPAVAPTTVLSHAPRTAAPSDRWAFVVGVTDYRAPTHDTIGGANDALLVRDSLLAAGWLPDHVRVLTDAAATGAGVRAGMAWLAEQDRPGSVALFHFSGHVKQLGGTTEALWPADRAFVPDTEVAAALGHVRGRLWVDVAGREVDSFSPGLAGPRVLFSGSSAQPEKSYEYPPWQRSVWTGLVFGLGMGEGAADADGDGRVTVGESLAYGVAQAQVITRDQRPYGPQTPQVSGDPDRDWTLDARPRDYAPGLKTMSTTMAV